MHGVPLAGLAAPEALQVGLHAVEVEQAHAVVARAGRHAHARMVHVQRRDHLALACMQPGRACQETLAR